MFGRPIQNGGLRRIQLDHAIVDAASDQGTEDVLNRVQAGMSGRNIGAADQLVLDQFDSGFQLRFAIQIDPAEHNTVIHWRRFECQMDHLPGMECFSVSRDFAEDSSLPHDGRSMVSLVGLCKGLNLSGVDRCARGWFDRPLTSYIEDIWHHPQIFAKARSSTTTEPRT